MRSVFRCSVHAFRSTHHRHPGALLSSLAFSSFTVSGEDERIRWTGRSEHYTSVPINVQLIVADESAEANAASCIPLFDIDVCQNWFDGRTLCVKDLLALTSKEASVMPSIGIDMFGGCVSV